MESAAPHQHPKRTTAVSSRRRDRPARRTMRAAGSAAGPAGAKAAPSQEMSDDALHAEYAGAFVLHNLVPFADKLLGIAGAMDQRPLSFYDWPLRLPFIVWAAARPTSRTALVVAHIINITFWAARMPAVWDYMCWVALTELTYIVAVLGCAKNQALMRDRFLPSVKALLVTLYFSAAFWKLTTGFLDPRVSCAATLVAELAAALFGARVPPTSAFARGLLASAPAQIVIIEFLVPSLLLAKHRAAVPDPNDRRKPGDHDYGKPGGYDNGAGHWNTLEKRCSNDDSKKCDSYINCPLGTPGDYGECEGAWFEHTDFDMDGFVTQSWLATSVGAMNRRRAVSFPQPWAGTPPTSPSTVTKRG